MKVLITGIAGFVGSYLAEECLSYGDEVYGLKRPGQSHSHLDGIVGRIHVHDVDLRDAMAMMNLLYKVRPEKIFHLAAQSFVPLSWKSPADTFNTNVIGQVNLFEAILELGIDPWVLIAGSSEEYGMVRPEETPIREENPLRPLSPYAVSKVTQDLMAYQYFKSHGIKTIRTRAFNHTGPRRNDLFVISSFCSQVARIEAGLAEPVIRVGNLDAIRDFSDVRDIVCAYRLALEKCEPGEVYNICSGKGLKIRDLLEIVLSKTSASVEVKQDPERMRPSDLPIVVGSYDKFNKATKWRPLISIEETIDDLLEYWRSQVRTGNREEKR